MKRPRFTIANLLVFVLLMAVGLAALRGATDLWDSAVFGATLVLLLGSVLLAIHRSGEKKAFWLGFALFGCAYLALSLAPAIDARLPTTKGLAYLDSKVSEHMVTFTFSPGTTQFSNAGGPVSNVVFNVNGSTQSQSQVRFWNATTLTRLSGPNSTAENFVRIGHSLLALMLGFLGAHLSRHLHASGQPRLDE